MLYFLHLLTHLLCPLGNMLGYACAEREASGACCANSWYWHCPSWQRLQFMSLPRRMCWTRLILPQAKACFLCPLKKKKKFETLIHLFLICCLSTSRGNLKINNEYIATFLFSYLLVNGKALQRYCITELYSTKPSHFKKKKP